LWSRVAIALFSALFFLAICLVASADTVVVAEYWNKSIDGIVIFVGAGSRYVGVSMGEPTVFLLFDREGRLLWSYNFTEKSPAALSFSPRGDRLALVVSESRGGSDYFTVLSYEASSGRLLWSSDTFDGSGGDIEYTLDGRLVIVTSFENSRVYGLDADSGRVVWEYRVDADYVSAVEVSENYLYIGGFRSNPYSGIILAIDLNSMETVWESSDIEDIVSSLDLSGDGRVLFASISIDEAGGGRAGKVYALDSSSGDIIWGSEKFGDYAWEVATVGDIAVVTAAGSDGIIILEASSGDVFRRVGDEGIYSISVASIPGTTNIVISYSYGVGDKVVSEVISSSFRVEEESPTTTSTTIEAPATTTSTSEVVETITKTVIISESRGGWGDNMVKIIVALVVVVVILTLAIVVGRK